ncbi:MAG: hypothetical protein MUF64_10540 [Polyangiaceae bacterium]|jgi:hypothetical protein|nr:hypothetical protein [Polyangiaceae bacterium]
MPIVLLLLCWGLAGCSSGPACEPRVPVQVPTAPPEPLEETESKAPVAPGMTWVQSHWHWDGRRWVWSPGHWASAPPGRRWAPPRYTVGDDGQHLYTPGTFGCIAQSEE